MYCFVSSSPGLSPLPLLSFIPLTSLHTSPSKHSGTVLSLISAKMGVLQALQENTSQGWKDSPAFNKLLALHVVESGSIWHPIWIPWAAPGVIPESRAWSIPKLSLGVAQNTKNKRKKLSSIDDLPIPSPHPMTLAKGNEEVALCHFGESCFY